MGDTQPDLQDYVTRIERLEVEADRIVTLKATAYREAKAAGLNKRTLRQLVIQRRADRLSV